MKKSFIITYLFFSYLSITFAQTDLGFKNLNDFKNPSKNWEIIGDISGKYDQSTLKVSSGVGILHCKPHTDLIKSEDLFFNFDHGDINLSFDFMVPKGSNSGVYLMGQYEVQLFDSWGVKTPKVHDCGAIYERWDETRGKGKEGFEGHFPRQNASLAPGLWQHMQISFIAPKFDTNGKKISNAKFVNVYQNGLLIHQNVELLGPTRGSLLSNEIARGPIRIQGDHGEVAFRNFKYELLDKQPVKLENLTYQYFEQKLEKLPSTLPAKASSKGDLEKINYRIAEKNSDFLISFNGNIIIPETDNYTFSMPLTGIGKLVIDGKTLIEQTEHHWRNEDFHKEINLTAGSHKLELWYARTFSWGGRALGLFVKRAGVNIQPLHEYISLPDPDPVGLIEVKATDPKPVLQRSFVYFDGKKRTHAINVGSQIGVHYAYDLERAALLSVWKGRFLNTTEMWFERGEPQIAEPLGASIRQDGKNPIFTLATENSTIPDSLSIESEWIYKGYHLNSERNPIFTYQFNGSEILDHIRPIENGSGLKRTIIFNKQMANTYLRAAESKNITSLGDGQYQLDNQFIILDNASNAKIIDKNGIKTLLVPISGLNVTYSIIW
jgi:Domain of Unknown Function (DUF1080)/PA14 domain